jgi:Amt family ammonium transporter
MRDRLLLGGLATGVAMALACAGGAFAQDAAAAAAAAAPAAPIYDSGNTAWMLASMALVLLMTIPGLALFYGGMVQKKNVLATVAQSFVITCLVSVLWLVVGYSIAFGTSGPDTMHPDDMDKWWGGLSRMLLHGIGSSDKPPVIAGTALTIPESVYCAFQMTFAIITPALIAGAFAERMKFSSMFIFMSAWLLLVYCPIAHWVWGGGFMGQGTLTGGSAVLDFAGGTVVHINAGVAGLMCALVMRKRTESKPPHNLVYTMIGASLLWVGWFGFNAGSEVAADGIAGAAMINTQVATALAALTWMFLDIIVHRKPTMLGLASGAVAGLVAITPASGFVNPTGALVIGAAGAAGAFFFSVFVKKIFKYDDSLDAFGVHAIGGAVGALLTGLFFDININNLAGALKADDAAAHMAQFGTQAIGVTVTTVYDAIVTLIILFILKFTIGLTVKREQEAEGLDLVLHGETVP